MSRMPVQRNRRLPRRLVAHVDRVRSSRHARASWDEVVARVVAARPAVAGFDVFDTLLTRSIPDGVPYRRVLADLLVAAGAWRGDAESYVLARLEAGRDLPNGSLAEWYRHPALASADADRCCAIEVELERGVCRAAPGAAAALGALRRAAVRIDFVSDMHLPGAVIRELLQREGLSDGDELLLVSCESGARKRDGGLFHVWAERRGAPPHRLCYVGNHPTADHVVPRSLGLGTVPRRAANLNRHERLLADHGVVGAAIAAASVQARLARLGGRHDAAVGEHGSSLLGQAMVAFLLWTRQRCVDDGVTALAFAGPGAAFAHRLAAAMPAGHWNGIDLVPLDHRCGGERTALGPARIAVAAVGPLGAASAAAVRALEACRCSGTTPSLLPLSLNGADHPGGPGVRATWSFLPAWASVQPVTPVPAEARVWASAVAVARALPTIELLAPYLDDVEALAAPVSALLAAAGTGAGQGRSTHRAQAGSSSVRRFRS